MTYGAEAVIPLETGFLTLRTSLFNPSINNESLKKSLEFIEERRESVMVQLAYYQHKLKQDYDVNVKLRPLVPSDLVVRKVLGTAKNPAWEKLGPNWEGPYRITSVAGIRAYFLENLDEHNTTPLEYKQPENVLLLMKVSFVNMFIYCVKALYFQINGIFMSVKQNLNHAWYLESYTLVKLTYYGIFISVK